MWPPEQTPSCHLSAKERVKESHQRLQVFPANAGIHRADISDEIHGEGSGVRSNGSRLSPGRRTEAVGAKPSPHRPDSKWTQAGVRESGEGATGREAVSELANPSCTGGIASV
jgi:hypothetical protein